jgi:hypothetical protein
VSTSSDDTDEDWHNVAPRGRTFSTSTVKPRETSAQIRTPSIPSLPNKSHVRRSLSRHASSSGASGSESPHPQAHIHARRTAFTRSPAVSFTHTESHGSPTTQAMAQARLAAMIARHQSLKVSHWLPARWKASIWLGSHIGLCIFSIDAKVAAESFVLLISLAGIRRCLSEIVVDPHDVWINRGRFLPLRCSTRRN